MLKRGRKFAMFKFKKINQFKHEMDYRSSFQCMLAELEDLVENTECDVVDLWKEFQEKFDDPNLIYDDAEYQHNLIQYYSSAKESLAKVAEKANKQLEKIRIDCTSETVSDTFYVSMLRDTELLYDQIMVYRIQIELLYAKYKGSTQVNLDIDLHTHKVLISTLK